jgi:hypothetical protein
VLRDGAGTSGYRWAVLDPQALYELSEDRPELTGSVLIQALDGFVDAGSAVQLAREHLLATSNPRLIARFDVDQLLDYRSRRPIMTFTDDHWAGYAEPVLGLHLGHDQAGTPFLLLAGPEPDFAWERFLAAVRGLVERLGVRLTVGVNAIPMAVPHTRPIGATAHATKPDLIAGHEPWLRRVQVPASVGNLLEYRLGQAGHDALGFAVHVPHYLAQAAYPAAAEAMLTFVSRATGLELATERLREAAELVRADVDAQIGAAEEAAALVRTLEQQYDAYLSRRTEPDQEPLTGADGTLPTADELGAELERFLAERSNPGEPPAG